jgi:membrane protein required for colicin V production
MIWADWFLLAALVVSILIGVIRGFTREILGLISWIVAIIAALLFGPSTVGWLEPHIATPSLRIAGSYALVFLVALLVGAILTSVVSMLVRKSALSGVDRMVGGGFGLVRGLLVGGVMVWLVGLTPARQDPWWKESMFIPRLEWLAEGLRSLTPEKWRPYLTPSAVPAPAPAKEGI